MSISYQMLVKIVFPRVQIIINRFHIGQQLTRSMTQLLIRNMNLLTHSKNQDAKNYRK